MKWIMAIVGLGLAYLSLWPVPIQPVPWLAPKDAGYSGAFAANNALSLARHHQLDGCHGPEDVAIDVAGVAFTGCEDGWIWRLEPEGKAERWVETQGRPLGLAFDAEGALWVADAYRGLLKISKDGALEVATDALDGQTIAYADDLTIAQDGTVYFTNASTRFGAKAFGGTYPASLLDIMEHGANGQVLSYTPATGETRLVVDGLHFPNGIALSADESFFLINETATYSVLKYTLRGKNAGTLVPIVRNLPGFPDNIDRGGEGRFWLGLVSPRNPMLDRMAPYAWLRSMVQRLPEAARPQAAPYGHVVAIDGEGEVLASLHDPTGRTAFVTGAAEHNGRLLLSSLHMKALAEVSIRSAAAEFARR